MNNPPDISAGDAAGTPMASALYLPRLSNPPATILDYLTERFPHVGRDEWRRRMSAGTVVSTEGDMIADGTAYLSGITVLYYREVPDEESIPFEEHIVYQDAHVLIADKPHFLPVVPSGPYVRECLLARLRRRTGLEALTPVHRLDRETAGLVIFSTDHTTRPLYHRMFAEGRVAKEYLAAGRGAASPEDGYTVANRIEQGEPWFRMRIAEGDVNAVTHVRTVRREGERVLFQVRPETGKKHQIRLHLLELGFPIVNDRLYPDVHAHAPYDFTDPLQLLAYRIAFTDPVTGRAMEFTSRHELGMKGEL